jgi:KaiC/GvpD/RAD55 family RecA-like ATPase
VDLDKALVAALIKGGKDALYRAFSKGLREEQLIGEGRKAYAFLVEYSKQYGEIPAFEIIGGRLNIWIDPVEGNSDYFVDEVLRRDLFQRIQTGIKAPIEFLSNRDPEGARRSLELLLWEIRRAGLGDFRVMSLPALGKDAVDYYDKIKAGYRGILTPWPSMNEATLGFWPQDLVLFVARLGTGKTFLSLMLADCAWDQGKRVLYISTEMGRNKIAQRWIALRLKLPYEEFRKGKLSAFVEVAMREKVESLLNQEGFYIVGGNFDFRMDSVEAAIDEAGPDMTIIDGAYLLRVSGENRIEQASKAYDELKRMCIRKNIPFVVTTQFNRQVKTNVASSVSAEKIALSDAAGWNADLIFGLVQTEDMAKDKLMTLKKLKFREGTAEDIRLRWDFSTMDFSELTGDPAVDDDFGSGVSEDGVLF